MKGFFATALISSAAVYAAPLQGREKTLEWGECDKAITDGGSLPDNIDCATLEVPLDYSTEDSEHIQLNLVRYRATKESCKGSILTNPGGPGGVGTDDVIKSAEGFYSKILDGHFNIIGFDPRGTGRTIPFACNYTGDGVEPAPNRKARRDEIPIRDMEEFLTSYGWDEAKNFAEVCAESEENQAYAKYISTASVVNDMVSIINALGEDGKLRYWGTSYGTILGQYFASMYPEKVDRMFLDAVADANDYRDSLWDGSMLDLDASVLNFFKECLDAPEFCSLANITELGTTAEEMYSSLGDYLSELKKNTTADVPIGSAFGWQVGTVPATRYQAVKWFIIQHMYYVSRFAELDKALAMLLSGDESVWEELSKAGESDANEVDPSEAWNQGPHALFGIACTDSTVRAESPEEVIDLVKAQQNSSRFADAYLPQLWACPVWQFDAPERYEGDFGSKPNHPILFSGGSHDPVTPIRAAERASTRFEGSGLLRHNGAGHGIASQESSCVLDYVRAYFIDGTLPEEDNVCEPDLGAFATIAKSLQEKLEASNSTET